MFIHLELFCCGRPAVDTFLKEDQWGLAPWAQRCIKEGKLNHIIDFRIRGQFSDKCMKNLAHLACRCLESKADKRPTMAEIVSRLELILSLQQTPVSSITKGKFIHRLLLFFHFKHESKLNTLISDHESKLDTLISDGITAIESQKPGNVISPTDGNLKRFTFSELKAATRNFRHGTVLCESQSTSVFKGWIDEPSLAAVKPGAGTAVTVKRFNIIESPQDQQKWLNYNAKLYNFGFAKDVPVDGKSHVSTQVMFTAGYAAPEYTATGQLTIRSDIYSFGVVLLEILTGRRCVDKHRPYNEQLLTEFVKPYVKGKPGVQLKHIMDSSIEGQYTLAVAMEAFILANKCLLEEPKHRPTADEVVRALEKLQ